MTEPTAGLPVYVFIFLAGQWEIALRYITIILGNVFPAVNQADGFNLEAPQHQKKMDAIPVRIKTVYRRIFFVGQCEKVFPFMRAKPGDAMEFLYFWQGKDRKALASRCHGFIHQKGGLYTA